ncbi:MAG: NAD-dependent epimerase/dehydratase family protein, partial [Gammaproteobacteria bacterium]|nr:NAD-dependent epimerase/dehydratase family protein [Gammaproteobacteria bacterium]
MSESVLVTGANGFLGGALLRVLSTRNGTLFAGVRDERQCSEVKGVKKVVLGDLSRMDGEAVMLSNLDVVIHCAARVHIMNDSSSSPLADFRSVNVEGTLSLARIAAQAGVKRFVFISSVKVNGERTDPDMPFIEDDLPFPEDPYGVSKCEAEQGLRTLAETTGMAVVIIRPPLVYGPGVKGNFLNLLKLAKSGLPLPLGSIHNQRSMIYLGNLVDLII